jgi:hypothetical protein
MAESTELRERGEMPSEQFEESAAGLANVASREDIPPDGGYGWVCTACVLLINANTWGVNSVRRPNHIHMDRS